MRNNNDALPVYEKAVESTDSAEKAKMEIGKARLLLACTCPMFANSYDLNDADLSKNSDSDQV